MGVLKLVDLNHFKNNRSKKFFKGRDMVCQTYEMKH
jgi:hypothetical protein